MLPTAAGASSSSPSTSTASAGGGPTSSGTAAAAAAESSAGHGQAMSSQGGTSAMGARVVGPNSNNNVDFVASGLGALQIMSPSHSPTQPWPPSEGTNGPTWGSLLSDVILATDRLRRSAKATLRDRLMIESTAVVESVRVLLAASNTARQDSPVFSSHPQLRNQHKAIADSLAKLLMSVKQASSSLPVNQDGVRALTSAALDVTDTVSAFVRAAQELDVEVSSATPNLGYPQTQRPIVGRPFGTVEVHPNIPSANNRQSFVSGDKDEEVGSNTHLSHQSSGDGFPSTPFDTSLSDDTASPAEESKRLALLVSKYANSLWSTIHSISNGAPEKYVHDNARLVSDVRSLVRAIGVFLSSLDDLQCVSPIITEPLEPLRANVYASVSVLVKTASNVSQAPNVPAAVVEVTELCRKIGQAVNDITTMLRALVQPDAGFMSGSGGYGQYRRTPATTHATMNPVPSVLSNPLPSMNPPVMNNQFQQSHFHPISISEQHQYEVHQQKQLSAPTPQTTGIGKLSPSSWNLSFNSRSSRSNAASLESSGKGPSVLQDDSYSSSGPSEGSLWHHPGSKSPREPPIAMGIPFTQSSNHYGGDYGLFHSGSRGLGTFGDLSRMTSSSQFGAPPSPAESNVLRWYHVPDFHPDHLRFTQENRVKGGTVEALVVYLTHHSQLDVDFFHDFLLTYRSFMSSVSLMQALERRFGLNYPLQEEAPGDVEQWVRNKLEPVRDKVCVVLRSWLETYCLDSDDDREALSYLRAFFHRTLAQSLPAVATEHLFRLLETRETPDGLKFPIVSFASAITTPLRPPTLAPSIRTTSSGGSDNAGTGIFGSGLKSVFSKTSSSGPFPPPPKPILPSASQMRKLKLLDLDPLETARQLTLIESEEFDRILPWELLDKAWGDESSPEIAANVKFMFKLSNLMSGWVAHCVTSERDVKKRAITLKYFITVAEKCLMLNNFNTLVSILAGLTIAPIHRLKRTWSHLPVKQHQVLEHLKSVMEPSKNYSRYREYIRTIANQHHHFHNHQHQNQGMIPTPSGCVPFLGVFLTDLTFTYDGTADLLQLEACIGAPTGVDEEQSVHGSENAPQHVGAGMYGDGPMSPATVPSHGHLQYGQPLTDSVSMSTSSTPGPQIVNFAKRAKVGAIIRSALFFQSVPYALTPAPEVQSFLRQQFRKIKDEASLYKLSLDLEPKEREEERAARMLIENGFVFGIGIGS